MWGIDFLGLFPLALGQLKYLVAAIDYFIKMDRNGTSSDY